MNLITKWFLFRNFILSPFKKIYYQVLTSKYFLSLNLFSTFRWSERTLTW